MRPSALKIPSEFKFDRIVSVIMLMNAVRNSAERRTHFIRYVCSSFDLFPFYKDLHCSETKFKLLHPFGGVAAAASIRIALSLK